MQKEMWTSRPCTTCVEATEICSVPVFIPFFESYKDLKGAVMGVVGGGSGGGGG